MARATHRRKIPVDQLPQAIKDILDQYENDLDITIDDVIRRVADKGAQALRQSSLSVIGGRYSRGWGYSLEIGRLQKTATIWHKETPGLPHLLENGHAKVTGGRVPGRPHIAPVAEIIEQDFIESTIRGIESL